MRTFDQAAKSPVMQHLIHDRSVDIYICTWSHMDAVASAGGQGACYVPRNRDTRQVNPTEISDTYQTSNVKIFTERNFFKSGYQLHNSLHFGRFQDYASMHFLIHQCSKYSRSQREKYDYVIRCRPDIYLMDIGNIPVSGATFPISGYIDGKLICTDLFFHGDDKSMERATSFYEDIDDYAIPYRLGSWHEIQFDKFVRTLKIPLSLDNSILFQVIRPDHNPGGIGFLLSEKELQARKEEGITFTDDCGMAVPEIPHRAFRCFG